MSVIVYAKKFEDMDAYSRQVASAPDEKWKIDQFLFGLRGEISHSVPQREFTTYAELLRQCYMAENRLKKLQEERDQYRVGLKDQGRPSHHFSPRPQPFKGKQVQNVKSTPPPFCCRCNKTHYGRCTIRGLRRYQCQGQGDLIIDCPWNNTQMQGKSPAWFYTLDAKKAKGSNALITGTCHVNDHPCFVLFDYGETHSFVSVQYMKCLGLKAIPLSPHMMVTTSMDDVVETHLICENCSLLLNGRVFHIDLICLPLKKVDVVLGID